MRRAALAVLLVIGVGLIVTPFAMSMFSRTSKGEQMVNDFRPLMQPAAVQMTADYYNNTFVKLRPIALAMNAQTVGTFNGYVQGLKAMEQELAKMPPAQMQALASQYPAMASMLKGLPQMEKTMSGFTAMMAANVDTFKNVPPGLDHYKPLVDTMQASVDNYVAVDAMPPMGFFPWFFIIPGIVFVLIAAYLFVGEINPNWVWPKLEPREPVAH
jgi:hypothetical protein